MHVAHTSLEILFSIFINHAGSHYDRKTFITLNGGGSWTHNFRSYSATLPKTAFNVAGTYKHAIPIKLWIKYSPWLYLSSASSESLSNPPLLIGCCRLMMQMVLLIDSCSTFPQKGMSTLMTWKSLYPEMCRRWWIYSRHVHYICTYCRPCFLYNYSLT